MVLNSCAKVNLSLVILNKRKDGYHNIRTIFERVNLCDKITLKPRKDNKIDIISTTWGLPKDKTKNLAYRAAELLQKESNIARGADIKISKRIPVGAGLGGGSSNAAYALLGLNRLWGLNFSRDKLASLAARLGSDVPFFVYDTPFALGKGRGEKILPLKAKKKLRLWHILVVPKLQVSTPVVYKRWDEFSGLAPAPTFKNDGNKKLEWGLTRHKYDDKILISGLKNGSLSLISNSVFNSLEAATFILYPKIKSVKEKLLKSGVKTASMSGSGSAVFGIVSSRKEAESLCRRIRKRHRHWQVFSVRTM